MYVTFPPCYHIVLIQANLPAFGGFGFASRMWGLTIDHIISAEVVLANGTIVTASNTTNSDLFWVCRMHFFCFSLSSVMFHLLGYAWRWFFFRHHHCLHLRH